MPRILNPTHSKARWQRIALLFAAILGLASFVTAAFPAIDLTVSHWFFEASTTTWPVAQSPFWQVVRQSLWWLADCIFIVAVVILVIRSIVPSLRRSGRPNAAFLATCYVLGPWLVVNVLLKEHWGRARPLDVMEFGGDHLFTSALMISDQCTHNCSFVGGEASAFAALFFVLFFMLRASPTSALAARLLRAAFLAAWFGSLLRVAFGHHFLSDILFAWLTMFAVVACIAAIFDRLKWDYRWPNPSNAASR